jgi:hypothetical protein
MMACLLAEMKAEGRTNQSELNANKTKTDSNLREMEIK